MFLIKVKMFLEKRKNEIQKFKTKFSFICNFFLSKVARNIFLRVNSFIYLKDEDPKNGMIISREIFLKHIYSIPN